MRKTKQLAFTQQQQLGASSPRRRFDTKPQVNNRQQKSQTKTGMSTWRVVEEEEDECHQNANIKKRSPKINQLLLEGRKLRNGV
jgi:hypothetical protein